MFKLRSVFSKMQFFTVNWVVMLTILLLSSGDLFAAKSGSITGRVTDKKTGSGLQGANIFLVGTSIGSATDLNGTFDLPRVPAGDYTIRTSYIGYSSQDIEIKIEPGQKLIQNIELEFDALEMEDVVVSAQRVGQVGAINRQLTANSVMNAVSSDRLRELPDANVAESVGRIPGVSLQRQGGEANKVVIRGLEPKLNAITVNGIKVPATSSGTDASATNGLVSKDKGDRSVDLSMMSSDLLEAIEVFKAPTPDMDAEAIGGIVNLKVKKAPEKRNILLRTNGGFNQLNDDFSDFKLVGQFSQRFFDNKLGVIVGANTEKINRGSERYNASFDTDGVKDTITGIVPVVGLRMNIRNTKESRKRFGGYLTLDYAMENGVICFTNFYSQTSRNPFSITKHYRPNQEGNIEYEVRYQEIDISGLSSSLNGEHKILGMDIDWILSKYTTETNNNYDMEMEFRGAARWDESILNRDSLETYIPAARDSLKDLYLRNNYFRPDTTTQTDHAAELNFKIPFTLGKKFGGFIKFGGKYTTTERERIARGSGIADYYQGGDVVSNAVSLYDGELEINPQGRIAGSNFIISETSSKDIINGDYTLNPLFDKNKLKDWHNYQKSSYFDERYALSDEYDLKEKITAGYLMAKLNFGQMLNIIPGVRYEGSDNKYNAVWSTVSGRYGADGTARDTTSTNDYSHWFPHLHIKFKPLSWFDLRASAIKTLARPNYYWMLPWTRLSSYSSHIDRGNPNLKPATSWNYELSSSFYSNRIGLLTVGGFYKDMTDIFFSKESYVWDPEMIEYLQIPGGTAGYRMRSYDNADEAKVWGFEIDLQTQLKLVPFLPNFLKGIVLNANYARIWSEAYYPQHKNTINTDYSTWPPTTTIDYDEWTRKEPMVGQAEQIFNISMGYDVGDLSTRVSVLYQGESLDEVGVIKDEDKWDDDFWRWDASAKYKLNDWISFNLSLSHIGGQPDRTFFGQSSRQTNRSYYGMTGTAGIQLYFDK